MSQAFWEAAAGQDPLWAILSDPSKKGRRWAVSEFFETGRREISLLMYQLQQLGHVPEAGRALDFGCGVGRLSQALSAFFPDVVGVDVSPAMIQLAERANKAPSRVRYVVNAANDLTCFASGTLDFIYSDIVLQHLPPVTAQRFVEEFVRIVKVGGVVVFQLASHPRVPDERPPVATAMADAAYRARITVPQAFPSALRPRDTVTVALGIENASGVAWDQATTGAIRVGNHWLSARGAMVIQDDGRCTLPPTMDPGQGAQVLLPLQAPDAEGTYICELDLVHEGLTWFGDRGSETVRRTVVVRSGDVPVAVTDASTARASWPPLPEETDLAFTAPVPEAAAIGEFPMHGVPRDTVLSVLTEGGAPVFHVEPDERAGPEWHGYRYFARKLR